MSTREYPDTDPRPTDRTTTTTTATTTTTDPTAGLSPPPASDEPTASSRDGSSAGAPLTFDPFCTRRCRNLVDDENAAAPDPDDVTVVRPAATDFGTAADD